MNKDFRTAFTEVAAKICGSDIDFEESIYRNLNSPSDFCLIFKILEKQFDTVFDYNEAKFLYWIEGNIAISWFNSHIMPSQTIKERSLCVLGGDYYYPSYVYHSPSRIEDKMIYKNVKYAKYNHIPPYFTFKDPMPNALYVVHPLNDKLYIPYEGSDVFILNEKVHDFIMFAAALGAKRVKAYAQVRHSNASSYSASSSVNGSVESRFGSASASYDSSSTNYEALAMSSTFNFEREFSGNERLDVLDRIPWYKHESTWQRLKDEKELFGMMSFKESISTSSMRTINSSNREAIKADLKLLFANVSGSYESTINSMVETQDDLIETIEVEF